MIVLSFTVRGDLSLVVVGTFDFTIVVTPCFYRVYEPAHSFVSAPTTVGYIGESFDYMCIFSSFVCLRY